MSFNQLSRKGKGKAMKHIFNGFIMLLSFYIVLLTVNGQVTLSNYFVLILLEWLLLLVGNPLIRQGVFGPFYKKGSLGEEDGPYGMIHIKTIEKDLTKITDEGFKQLIIDLYQNKGYKMEYLLEDDLGTYLMVRRNKELLAIGISYQSEGEEVAWKEMTEAVHAKMKAYKANRGMVITNSRFQNYHIKEARPRRTELMDIDLLIPFVKEGILLSRKNH